jgi:hypothetical protein
MYGIDNVDTTGTFLRRGIGLNNEFVEEIIHRCYEQFGGKRFKISTFTALIPGGNSDIAPEDMPLEVIHSVQELTRNLHLFLPMRLEPTQATLGEYVEFLIDDEGKILTPETIKTLLDTSRNLPQLPIELAWMDRFIERMQTFFGSDFDRAIWPILAIYLLALKISSRGRSKHT